MRHSLATVESQRAILGPIARRRVLKVVAIGIVLYSIAVLIYSNLVPFLGIDVFGQVIHDVAEPPRSGPSPEAGDTLVELAGQEIDSLPRFVNTLANLKNYTRFPRLRLNGLDELATCSQSVADIGSARYVRLKVRRQENPQEIITCWYEAKELPWQRSATSIIWFTIESLIFWTSWLVFRRRPQDDAAAIFFLMCVATVGAYMGGYHWLRIATNPALTFVFALCAMAVPQISLHFFLMYPKPKFPLYRHPILCMMTLYVLPGLLQVGILWSIGATVFAFRHDLPISSIQGHIAIVWQLVRIYLVIAAAMFVGCVVCLVHSYWQTQQPVQRSQVRSILYGALLSSIFVGYSLFLAVTDSVRFALGGATWAMFMASMTFTVAYAVSILRYRLLDVEDILQRGLIYLLITFAAGLCYYGLVLLAIWFSPMLMTENTPTRAFLTPTFIIFALLILGTIRTRVQRVLDRRFYREKHQLERTMLRMNEAVGKLIDVDLVTHRGLLVINDTLGASDAAIYLKSPDGDYLRSRSLGATNFPEKFAAADALVRMLAMGELLQATPGTILIEDEPTQLLRRFGVEVAQPLCIEKALFGFVLVRPRTTEWFNDAELEFLSGIAEMMTVALRSADAQRTLEQLNDDLREKVARISRQQRQLVSLQPNVSVENPSVEVAPDEREGEALIGLRGRSSAMTDLIDTVRKVSLSQATVLIRGESGTGKTMLAESIHRLSPRAAGPFVKVHCAALSPGVLESELFGHVKGAFTGAHRDKQGRFETADRGSIFLDEIGDVSLDLQTKLLRVLQESTFEPVGSTETIKIDVRIIAATHQPLEELIRKGKFREDLYYRLNVISLRAPSLRERQSDILELSAYFLKRFAAQSQKGVEGFDQDVIDFFENYSWPGNVRELENVVARAVILTDGPLITLADLPDELQLGDIPVARSPVKMELAAVGAGMRGFAAKPRVNGLVGELDELEKAKLVEALRVGGGNKSKAAAILGIPRSTFCSKLKKFGLL